MDPVVRAAFASVILERRLQLNLSQKEVAQRSGYSEEYLGKLERREHTPSLTAVVMVSTGLEKDPTDTLNDVRTKMFLFKWLEGKDPEAADASDPDHTEPVEFRCAKRSHAGSAEYGDAFAESPENFLVPNRWDGMKVAVDDPDGWRMLASHSLNVAKGCWRAVVALENSLRVHTWHWSKKNHRSHETSFAWARGPGQ